MVSHGNQDSDQVDLTPGEKWTLTTNSMVKVKDKDKDKASSLMLPNTMPPPRTTNPHNRITTLAIKLPLLSNLTRTKLLHLSNIIKVDTNRTRTSTRIRDTVNSRTMADTVVHLNSIMASKDRDTNKVHPRVSGVIKVDTNINSIISLLLTMVVEVDGDLLAGTGVRAR